MMAKKVTKKTSRHGNILNTAKENFSIEWKLFLELSIFHLHVKQKFRFSLKHNNTLSAFLRGLTLTF